MEQKIVKSLMFGLAASAIFNISHAQNNDALAGYANFMFDSHRRTAECAGYYKAMGNLAAGDSSTKEQAAAYFKQASIFMQFSQVLEAGIRDASFDTSNIPKLTEGRLKFFEDDLKRLGWPADSALALMQTRYLAGCPVALEQIPRELELWASKLKK